MLNAMKVEEFREKQLEKYEENKERILRSVFSAMQSVSYRKAQQHHTMTMYCKVFKALMNYRLQLDDFAERLEGVYFQMLLGTHFAAIKEFKNRCEQ
jgi:hypothetical protein